MSYLPVTESLTLMAYLIKPLQRITKYPLLIREILKYIEKETKEYDELNKAYKASQDLCEKMNEILKDEERLKLLDWMQDHLLIEVEGRKLIFNALTSIGNQRNLLLHTCIYKVEI